MKGILKYFLNFIDYKILEKIGEGSFSEVVKVREIKTGIFYAAKKLNEPFGR